MPLNVTRISVEFYLLGKHISMVSNGIPKELSDFAAAKAYMTATIVTQLSPDALTAWDAVKNATTVADKSKALAIAAKEKIKQEMKTARFSMPKGQVITVEPLKITEFINTKLNPGSQNQATLPPTVTSILGSVNFDISGLTVSTTYFAANIDMNIDLDEVLPTEVQRIFNPTRIGLGLEYVKTS
ncbi:MAG: hypothetical protein JKY48_15760 [Flavobacteriales bacterium]|nr:hypothetical protein [Flavobacteriales bacterium]